MGGEVADDLAIRTVLVTTRAAIRTHDRGEHPELVRLTALRGIEMLDEIARTRQLRNGATEKLTQARRELRALSEGP